MKQWIAALLLMLIPGVQAAKPQKVTLMVDDVPVAQVLQALAEQEKLNLWCRQTSAVRCRYI